jgi:hypothetical protein
VGATNEGKVREVLKEMGKNVMTIAKGGWRPSKQGVEEMLKEMEGKFSEDIVIIFYGIENGLFYAEDNDGDRSLPKSDAKGVYHVNGKLELATEKQAKGLMANSKPVMDRIAGNWKIILSPGLRFHRETCCESESQCVNTGEAASEGACWRIWPASGKPWGTCAASSTCKSTRC